MTYVVFLEKFADEMVAKLKVFNTIVDPVGWKPRE